LTTKIKPFVYVSHASPSARGFNPACSNTEDADVRVVSATRKVDDSYANGYGNSKWGGEVLLREANQQFGLPASVFRCDISLPTPPTPGAAQTCGYVHRMMLSLWRRVVAPYSFYELVSDGNAAGHYDGLPVEFIAEAISTLGVNVC